ncbi:MULTISPECIES: ParB/RepB/Spo0J family partition protein [unclassified Kitasatospora]|uniref:ParB/RepB/Spo0J family partition protein n=1 Tax=unclassified Kitasatospora TaxID=2633591 RepID=UPI0033F53C45
MPLTQLVPTRFNPRRNFGTEEELRKFGLKLKKKQLQPAVAVTRDAYLKLWPGEAEKIGGAVYVIANGERRWRGSQAAGVLTLDVVVDDEIAKSRADFLDAVLSENNDREDLDPIERALGIRTMVEELDGKAKVAEHYGKSPGWVTQQMYLLDLAPELQELVSSGELPLRETRALAKLPVHEQVEAWRARSAEREEEKAQPRQPRSRQKQSSDGEAPGAAARPAFTAVKKSATDGADEASEAVGFTAVKPTVGAEPSPAQRDASVPHQASAEDAAAAGPLADFAVYVSKAGAFADSVQGLAQAYAKARETDQDRTAELAAQLRAHVLRVVDQLPDVCPVEDATA